MKMRMVAGLAAVGLASTLWVGAAGADPKGEVLELVCNNGQTYTVATNPGSGSFTPAFDVDSNSVLVPVTFGAFTGTLFDDEGNVVESFTEPAESKGRSAQRLRNAVTCSFTVDEVSDGSDPEFPEGYRFVGGGTVVVKVTPAR